MASYLDRSIALLGEDKITSFSDKTILVFGIGGVGGTAVEALARSGFKHLILVDSDVVDVTNLNRQILFTGTDVGKAKVDVAKEKILGFCRDIDVITYKMFIDENNIFEFKKYKIDYVIDAIDKVPSKIAIYKFCEEQSIPLISSLGMGNRVNPECVTLTTLNKTENDPLAKKLRYEAKQRNLDLKKISVVFSNEPPLQKGALITSMIMVPSTAGLLIAKHVILNIN